MENQQAENTKTANEILEYMVGLLARSVAIDLANIDREKSYESSDIC